MMFPACRRAEAWPTMITPFNRDGRIDWPGVDRLTDWFIAAGMDGIFAVCQSSEMYDLSEAERIELAARVVRRAAGRVHVVATGTFGGPISEQAEFVKRVADTGVDCVVCLVNQLAGPDEPDDAWKRNTERLLAATADLRLGLYECPLPHHRLLGADLLAWAAGAGRFVFMKETSARLALIRAKIAVTRGTPLRFFNANTRTLLESLRDDADGFCGIAANFYPDLMAWLCRNFAAQPETADALQRFLTLAQPLLKVKYPASAKRYLAMEGLAIEETCRVCDCQFNEDEDGALAVLREAATEWRARLALPADSGRGDSIGRKGGDTE